MYKGTVNCQYISKAYVNELIPFYQYFEYQVFSWELSNFKYKYGYQILETAT